MNPACKATLKSIFLAILVSFVALPVLASAETYYFNPQSGTYSTSAVSQVHLQNPSQFTNQYQAQLLYIQQLQSLISLLESLLNQNGDDFNFDDDDDDSSGNAEISITTLSAEDIEDERARLRGEVDFDSSDFAYVWFEYGEDDDDLDESTPRVRRDDDDDEEFAVILTRLEEDQRYHFRAAGKDEDGRNDYGSTRSFTTDDDGRNNDDDDDDDDDQEPDVETRDANDITDDSAVLEGEVDMNDFEDGLVFLVYGEDEDLIDDIESDFDSYDDVDEDGDDLQKVQVDSGLDDDDSYEEEISGLDFDTEYFYAYCVEYEDEDDDETLTCGGTESFETDN